MSELKTIVVIGATGAQGGSVVRHLLPLKQFKLKAVSRKPICPASKALSDMGVEVIAADLGNMDSLRRAFKDAWGVFGVTNYWEHSDKEVQHGINMIDVAKEMGVKFFVWSSVDHENPKSGSKDDVTTHLKESGLPHAIFFPALYFENISYMWTDAHVTPKLITIPAPADAPLLWYSVEDTGAYVSKAFLEPKEYQGKDIRAGVEWITPRQVVDKLNLAHKDREFKLDAWDEKKFDQSPQNALTTEIYSIMKFIIAHPQSDPIRKSSLSSPSRLQSFKAFIDSHQQVLTGHPRDNLKGSGTYIPTPLRSSSEEIRLQPELLQAK